MGHHVPRRVLAEMAITGEPLDAQQALTYGLVNHVAADLYAMKAIEIMAFEESISFAESQIGLLALTEDSAEGQLAYREKRAPVWSGR